MFLRRPVPVHLKSVVAYCKNLGKCQIFLAQSIAASLIGLKGSGCAHGDVCHGEDVKATPSPLEVSRYALLLLPRPDSWVSQQILNACFHGGKLN